METVETLKVEVLQKELAASFYLSMSALCKTYPSEWRLCGKITHIYTVYVNVCKTLFKYNLVRT